MFHRIARIALTIVLLQICGGHWGILQTAAWVGMVVNFAQKETSLPVAIEKTFSGEHPCGLCEAVTKGRSEEQKQEPAKVITKIDAVLIAQVALPLPENAGFAYEIEDAVAIQLSLPPIPPPPLLG